MGVVSIVKKEIREDEKIVYREGRREENYWGKSEKRKEGWAAKFQLYRER